MGVELGGRASKLGNSYERLWAVRHALLVIEGRFRSLLWEPCGEDENGIDLWVVAIDGHRIGHQLKRQNRSKQHWSAADVREEGILQAAKRQLERDRGAEYVFVSSCGVVGLRDLAERSRRHDDPATFVRDHVDSAKDRRAAFAGLLSTWDLHQDKPDDVETAFRLLRRMTFEVCERTDRVRYEVEHIAGLQVDGDPKTVVARIGELLDGNLGKELHADRLRQELRNQGFQPRRLAGDPSVPAAIDQLQQRLDRAIKLRLIAGRSIPRPESAEILQRITGDKPPRVVFVHGASGSGKSVVLHQLFVKLRQGNVPVLPLQLHIARPCGTPHSFGRTRCDLPGSPANALRAMAGDRRAVAILDQLDSLRHTSAHSHETWAAFAELIDDVLADPAMTAVIACRSFDLENDPNIDAWRRDIERQGADVLETRVGELPAENVAEITKLYDVVFTDLPPRYQALLRQPQNLALWHALAEKGELPASVDNATQLMQKFINTRRAEAVREHNVQEADVGHVLTTLVSYLDNEGRLDAPVSLLGRHTCTLNALCSVGLIDKNASVITFAHQSYFDHLVAEQLLAGMVSGEGNVGEWLRANQSLFRRDQLRQLLTLLRDSDPERHEELLRTILLSEDIRFHLKHLALGLLRQADPVLNHETELVAELSRDPAWWDHVGSVIWARPAWFDALDRRGVLADWLADSADDERIRRVLRCFRTVAKTRGDRIDELLAPYWDAGGCWSERLVEVLWVDPRDDSPRMAELRRSKVEAGEVAFSTLFLDELAKQSPARCVDLLDAGISAWLGTFRAYLRSPDAGKPDWPLRDPRQNAVLVGAIRTEAKLGWRRFAAHFRTIARLSRMRDRLGIDWNVAQEVGEAHDVVESFVIASTAGLAQTEPDCVDALLKMPSRQRGFDRAIVKALAEGDRTLADRAILWLLQDPTRFCLGNGHDEVYWEPARALIEHFSPHCEKSVFARLESAILAYHDDSERGSFRWQQEELQSGHLIGNSWGRAQNVLLAALPLDRMSERARPVRATWQRKFGDPAKERPAKALVNGGWVTSPIPPNRLQFVSDREWLRIIRKEWPKRDKRPWRVHGAEAVGEASLPQFVDAFASAVRHNPKRFATLALRIPRDSNPAYFAVLMRELAATSSDNGEPLTIADMEAVIEHVGDCDDRNYVEAMCKAVVNRHDGQCGLLPRI